jgi:hypothetical protein
MESNGLAREKLRWERRNELSKFGKKIGNYGGVTAG